jgi:predicted nucleic acid-binding protein
MFDTNDHPAQTQPFWEAVFAGQVRVIVSDVLVDEIDDAPPHVRDFFATLPQSQIERIVSTDGSNALAERYIAESVVGETNLTDCKHVALASIAGADVLVSWNCKHIVKLNKIRKYNGINMTLGYPQIEIRTPNEVIHD